MTLSSLTFTKNSATSYNVLRDGTLIGRVGRMPGTSHWWAHVMTDDGMADGWDGWSSRAAAARHCDLYTTV